MCEICFLGQWLLVTLYEYSIGFIFLCLCLVSLLPPCYMSRERGLMISENISCLSSPIQRVQLPRCSLPLGLAVTSIQGLLCPTCALRGGLLAPPGGGAPCVYLWHPLRLWVQGKQILNFFLLETPHSISCALCSRLKIVAAIILK